MVYRYIFFGVLHTLYIGIHVVHVTYSRDVISLGGGMMGNALGKVLYFSFGTLPPHTHKHTQATHVFHVFVHPGGGVCVALAEGEKINE